MTGYPSAAPLQAASRLLLPVPAFALSTFGVPPWAGVETETP